ncbi:MAG TPA: hypothetical protein VGL42_05035 [Opitutaceae bacterium]|jgi:predicted RNA binding protein YcfA (HicA-like mRNA interferase family)
MSDKVEKIEAALKDRNRDKNHRLADVEHYLSAKGWAARTKGSHRILTKGTMMINIQPTKEGKVKGYQIRQIRKLLF